MKGERKERGYYGDLGWERKGGDNDRFGKGRGRVCDEREREGETCKKRLKKE